MSRITALELVQVDPSVASFLGAPTAPGIDAVPWRRARGRNADPEGWGPKTDPAHAGQHGCRHVVVPAMSPRDDAVSSATTGLKGIGIHHRSAQNTYRAGWRRYGTNGAGPGQLHARTLIAAMEGGV